MDHGVRLHLFYRGAAAAIRLRRSSWSDPSTQRSGPGPVSSWRLLPATSQPPFFWASSLLGSIFDGPWPCLSLPGSGETDCRVPPPLAGGSETT